jgi:hypothetical protein
VMLWSPTKVKTHADQNTIYALEIFQQSILLKRRIEQKNLMIQSSSSVGTRTRIVY